MRHCIPATFRRHPRVMNVAAAPIPRRLSPEASRDAALEAAHTLLVEEGPQGVTLKAVAARIGRTHATLLHHFGSAAGLQQALIGRLVGGITDRIRAAALRARQTDRNPREVVDLAFDAFAEGAGQLASWMIITGNRQALDPVLEAIHALVDDLAEGHPDMEGSLADETLQLVLMALGDALLGPSMANALGLPSDRARALATEALLAQHRRATADA